MRQLLPLCLLLVALPARGTQVLDLTGPELVVVSDAIVHARVLDVRAIATNEGRVVTEASLEVLEGLKGLQPGARIKVVYPGGQAKALGMLVSGQIALRPGGECVLYLVHNNGVFTPSALSLGYFNVTQGHDGRRVARRNTHGLTLVRRVRVAGMMQTVVREGDEVRAPLSSVVEGIRKDLLLAKRLDRDTVLRGKR